ncbi:MAG TPA: hypothetical protein VFU89_03540 [Rhabdochlamydiaceae bacterium]|nr:hypothetical protein [Rhabdochlamydiaceae bacterium]
MSTIKPLPFSEYGTSTVEITNDPFPTEVYRQLQLTKNQGVGDYKVGGSAALKLATCDPTWENDDVDIMVQTAMDTREYAAALGLTNLVKSWTSGIDGKDPDREERFHEAIYQVLTFQHGEFDKKIQLVFFKHNDDYSFINFLDLVLDYPAHVLYEVNFTENGSKTYDFFLPVKMWTSILQKRIPRNLHCMQSEARIQKYMKRGFEFYNCELPRIIVIRDKRVQVANSVSTEKETVEQLENNCNKKRKLNSPFDNPDDWF